MPYGVYTVHQTSGWEGRELMKDFDVFIAQNGQTYRYLINNANFESYIKVVKVDAESGKTIAQREELANEVPTKSKGERIVEEAMGKPIQKDGASHENPTVAKTDKNPPSRQSSAEVDGKSDKGISKSAEEKMQSKAR